MKKEKELERSCYWNWNGQVCRFDVTEPLHMGRLIVGLTNLKAELAVLPKDMDADLAVGLHREILRHFFDMVLGTGVCETLCSSVSNCGSSSNCGNSAYALAYLDFMAFVTAQLQWLEELLDAAEQRYRLMGAALGWVAAKRTVR